MHLPVPDLDSRRFEELLQEAWERIHKSCPQWTDRSPHDPGTVLLEAFAYLTEVMIYRLNRLPEKAYVSFLNLLGTKLHPPSAASATVEFTRDAGANGPILIPKGTQVATAGGSGQQPIVFTTTKPKWIKENQPITVRMHHCALVEGELIGTGNGRGGQVMRVKSPPIVQTNDSNDVLLAVEAPADDTTIGRRTIEHEGKVFEIWEPVGAFTGSALDKKCYLIDRVAGVITFAPELDLRPPPPPKPNGDKVPAAAGSGTLIAEVPAIGQEVRLWYRTGGGLEGNVGAGTLTNLSRPIAGVKQVSNPQPASGGKPQEALESALLRGPYQFFTRQRAVTARDFEMLAISEIPRVARAYAFTSAEMYGFAPAGQVDVILVPGLDRGGTSDEDFRLPAKEFTDQPELEEVRAAAEKMLNERRALGTHVRVSWAKYKTVSVHAKVVVRDQADIEIAEKKIYSALYQMISPLPTDLNLTGWNFGEPLRLSNVYRVLEHAHTGIHYVSGVRLKVDSAPAENVRAVAVDQYQSLTAYAGANDLLFRSTNGGIGWEQIEQFTGEAVQRIVPPPAKVREAMAARPGQLAVVTQRVGADGAGGSRVWISTDLGDSWNFVAELAPRVNDLAWIHRDGRGSLLLATDSGLFELAPEIHGAVPLAVQVDAADADRGFYAVCAFVSERGVPGVALAAQAQLGTYVSLEEGRSGTFHHIGLSNVDTRTLAVQYDGPTTILWTGVGEADPEQVGRGCFRARLYEADVVWQPMQEGWTGGTCRALAFDGQTIVAATHRGGVLSMNTALEHPTWQSAGVNCGLPLREPHGFQPVDAIAVLAGDPDAATPAARTAHVLAGGSGGVYRSSDRLNWTASAEQDAGETLTVPGTWLICSGEHSIEVTAGDASSGD